MGSDFQPGQNLPEEIIESRSRSFLNFGLVADDYAIENGILRPLLGGRPVDPHPYKGRQYMPMGRTELPGEFAKIAGGTEEQVLAFARRYGLLGYSTAFRFLELVGAGEMQLHDVKCEGDPVSWILAHADSVKLILSLADAMETPSRLISAIEQLTVFRDPHNPAAGKKMVYVSPKRGYHFASQAESVTFADPKEAALHIVSHLLNDNLTGIYRELIPEYQNNGKIGLNSIFYALNLLDCIYWLTADAVTAGRVRTCEFCGKPFVSPDPRTKYCPPLMGLAGVSACMNRAKQQRWRGNQKEDDRDV